MTRHQVEALDEEIQRLRDQRIALIDRMQDECDHPKDEILEADYYKGYLSTKAPFRVCRKCGYAEEGWGCGYWKLKHVANREVLMINRDVAHKKYVLRFRTQEETSDLRFGK